MNKHKEKPSATFLAKYAKETKEVRDQMQHIINQTKNIQDLALLNIILTGDKIEWCEHKVETGCLSHSQADIATDACVRFTSLMKDGLSISAALETMHDQNWADRFIAAANNNEAQDDR